jgi:hypothetical protein
MWVMLGAAIQVVNDVIFSVRRWLKKDLFHFYLRLAIELCKIFLHLIYLKLLMLRMKYEFRYYTSLNQTGWKRDLSIWPFSFYPWGGGEFRIKENIWMIALGFKNKSLSWTSFFFCDVTDGHFYIYYVSLIQARSSFECPMDSLISKSVENIMISGM